MAEVGLIVPMVVMFAIEAAIHVAQNCDTDK